LSDDDPAEGPESPGEAARPAEASSVPAAGRADPGLAAALEPPPTDDAAEAYERRARLAEDRLAEVLAAYRTLKTENDGYRDRITRNIERRYEQRRERLLLKFIDILDNMDRALEAAETTYAGEPLIEGLILVRTQLLQTLQEEGLERIPVLGLPYDPNFSEAVQTQAVDDPDHHQVVVKEMLRGYRLNGRLARASRVVVGEYPGAGQGQAAPPDPEPVPQPEPPAAAVEAPAAAHGAESPSLEEIIAKAEAQEALFPKAFNEDDEGEAS
jgi:molecular chaperone GrpE